MNYCYLCSCHNPNCFIFPRSAPQYSSQSFAHSKKKVCFQMCTDWSIFVTVWMGWLCTGPLQWSGQHALMLSSLLENATFRSSQGISKGATEDSEFVPNFKQTRKKVKLFNGLLILTFLCLRTFQIARKWNFGVFAKGLPGYKRTGRLASWSSLWRQRTLYPRQKKIPASPSISIVLFLNAALGTTKEVWCFRGELQSGQTTPQCTTAWHNICCQLFV